MTSLQATVRRHLTPILLLLLAGGYLVILGELVMYQHWDGAQLIGFSATVLGLLAVLLGLFAKGGLRIGLAVLLVILSISGLIGVYEHYETRAEDGLAAQPVLAQAGTGSYLTIAYHPNAERVIQQEGDNDEDRPAASGEAGEVGEAGGEAETPPPPLAPLSLAGLSLMGAAILLAKRDDRELAAA